MSHPGYEARQHDYGTRNHSVLEHELDVSQTSSPLIESLKPLFPSPNRPVRANRFIEDHNWLPSTKREATLYSHPQGVADILWQDFYAGNNRQRSIEDKLKATKKDFNLINGGWKKSRTALHTLRQATQGTGTELEYSPEVMHANPDIQLLFIEHVLNHRKLDGFYWPQPNAGVLASAHEQIDADIDALDPLDMARLFVMVRESHANKMRYLGVVIHDLRSTNSIFQNLEAAR